MVQETDAWFGLFGGSDGDCHKASAQHCSMMRKDKISFYTKGYTVHGEWFLDGDRFPRRPSGPAPTSIHLHDLPPWAANCQRRGMPTRARPGL